MKPFILISVCASLLDGQAAEFEVATVKVNKSGQGIRGGCHGVDSVYTPVEAASAPPLATDTGPPIEPEPLRIPPELTDTELPLASDPVDATRNVPPLTFVAPM